MLSGLSENMPAAMALFEKLMANAKVNPEAYTNMANDILKSRKDAKLNQMQNFSRLVTYATYGPKSPSTNILTEAELTSMDPQELVDRIKQLNSFKHRILYYGPNNQDELLAIINKRTSGSGNIERNSGREITSNRCSHGNEDFHCSV